MSSNHTSPPPPLASPADLLSLPVLVAFLQSVPERLQHLPGSAIVLRYIRSSYQNDPWRSALELALFLFALRVWLSKRTRGDAEKGYVRLSESEIDELVSEWTPEPLVQDTPSASAPPVILGAQGTKPRVLAHPDANPDKAKQVLNLASYNFHGLAGDQRIKDVAVRALRVYGVGSCGPPGFYGTMDAHTNLERTLAQTLSTEGAIIYAQSFATITSVIPAFAKRGDIIIADAGCNFAIRKGLQISRSTIRWYRHGDMESLERVLESVARESKKRGAKLTRRFICTEGVFQNDGFLSDLPKLVELKKKFKYRLILDESYSFGTVGRTGKGLTELYDVPARDVDVLVGSMANTLGGAGGFCAGEQVVVDHQRINSASFVFSAALPPLLAIAATETLSILASPSSGPQILSTLNANILAFRAVLLPSSLFILPSDERSPIQHIVLARAESDLFAEDVILQEVVDEALANGVLIARARRLRGQEADIDAHSARVAPGGVPPPGEPRPSLKIALTAGLTRKETEKAAGVVKAALAKVLGRRR